MYRLTSQKALKFCCFKSRLWWEIKTLDIFINHVDFAFQIISRIHYSRQSPKKLFCKQAHKISTLTEGRRKNQKQKS